MKRKLVLTVILIIFSLAAIAGCGGGKRSSKKIYGGVDPKGDYIAITIEGSSVTYDNYTTSEHYGPFGFSKETAVGVNGGFKNIYRTVYVDPSNKYVRFVEMTGVTIIYQMFQDAGVIGDFTDDDTVDNPVYAFCRKQVSMNDYRDTAYNWIEFKMGADNASSNFSAGCAGFDTNTDSPPGRLYGAGYSKRREIADPPSNGLNNINESNLGTSSFTYNPTIVANTAPSGGGDTLTLIGAKTNDFILDFGLNNGAGFAIRQASGAAYQSTYNGTYIVFCYENNNDSSVTQTIQVIKMTLENGVFKVFQMSDNTSTATPDAEGTLTAIADCTEGPAETPIKTHFQTVSGCGDALSTKVQNSYNCYGGFVNIQNSGNEVNYLILDPAGKYLCFTCFYETAPDIYNYRFGFGIKDPLYSNTGL